MLTASPALAKTEGNYLGVYGMLAKASPKDTSDTNGQVSKDSTRRVRLGFNYQHAFNLNNFFVSPEVFVEALELQNNATASSSGDKLEINSRYGFKANVGYDVNEKFSPYVTLGRGVVEYSSQKTDTTTGDEVKKMSAQSGTIYGLGANFHINESLTANLEYNKQNVGLNQALDEGKYKTDITSLRFGVAYHF
ncbi:MAG: outer membrane beta-barrel protein [Rickettsiales bacterium]|nr:outer membrane beta-barrel protein [Rickettsiales bacterium]